MALSIRCEANYQSHKPRDIHYLWQGDQLSQQQSHYVDGRIVTTQWVYEPGTFRPLAQIRQLDTVNKVGELERGKPELHYAITDMAGNVKELCDPQGQVQWRSEQGLWQALYQWRLERSPKQYLEEAILDPLHCDLRHQGQIVDEETGLYYNCHRYYDPQICQYLSPDPIGLAGGTRPQAYVHNPLEWVDPLGLLGDLVRYKPRDDLSAMTGNRRTAIYRAWTLEKELIERTGAGTRDWSLDEKNLIQSTSNKKLASVMSQAGYTGHHINSVEGNGILGDKWKGDPRNIVFLQNNDHPSKNNEHVYSLQGHRGNTRNSTQGRLIDRQAMINLSRKCEND